MRTLVFILLVSSTAALTLPFADAELQCDRGSLLDCARHALAEEPRLNASAQELVVVGLENLIARSPGAQIAELAGLADESRIRAAADDVGGFVCDGGRTLRARGRRRGGGFSCSQGARLRHVDARRLPGTLGSKRGRRAHRRHHAM